MVFRDERPYQKMCILWNFTSVAKVELPEDNWYKKELSLINPFSPEKVEKHNF